MTKFHLLNDRICPHSNDAAHGVEIPAGARLLFTNGQVGSRPDGTIPTDPSEQIEIIFERLQFILEASDMTFQDVIKLTVYVADPDVLEAYHQNRARFLGDVKPPATLLLVGSFPRPGIMTEIEAVAAKSN
ncbi:MAG: enamine deaminase RidA [Rhodospirillaceae bacterium]|nr:enamine deaminase RidA [Rhodospirillaceae bacterium]|tara:strand:+ start:632 stop:1024 length:393 start_codon:yes stop_codon:yes gene_type:complete